MLLLTNALVGLMAMLPKALIPTAETHTLYESAVFALNPVPTNCIYISNDIIQ